MVAAEASPCGFRIGGGDEEEEVHGLVDAGERRVRIPNCFDHSATAKGVEVVGAVGSCGDRKLVEATSQRQAQASVETSQHQREDCSRGGIAKDRCDFDPDDENVVRLGLGRRK